MTECLARVILTLKVKICLHFLQFVNRYLFDVPTAYLLKHASS